MKKSIFFYKELTPAEVGNTGTHEIYVRMPNDFDYVSFFGQQGQQNNSVIEVLFVAKDITNSVHNPDDTDLRFVFFANSNREKRMPGLRNLFEKHNVQNGDIFFMESRLENGSYTFFIKFFKQGSMLLSPKSFVFSKEDDETQIVPRQIINASEIPSPFRPLLTAIRTKPFLLLAGISGTGKSRIVRELARACSGDYHSQKPQNFEMIQVKPNWHDSSDILGYVSRVGGTPEFVAGDFLKFVVKAWEYPEMPYFLCLDEMNLAPVEQYFAEFLSVFESRKLNDEGNITTDPILKPEFEKINPQDGTPNLKPWYSNLIGELLSGCPADKHFALKTQFETVGISLPQNLIIVGTVNMDETTFSFSRKVLDRAMTIEMNTVDLRSGLDNKHESIGKISKNEIIADSVEGVDVYQGNKEVCDQVLDFLQKVNDVLEGSPFKIAYRTRNEFLIYVVNNLPYKKDNDGVELTDNQNIGRSLDEITCMKILPRIEGDEERTSKVLDKLEKVLKEQLAGFWGDGFEGNQSISLKKIDEMKNRLVSGYTSFWS